jgi:radical SAM protein with 4Fe4S-binding SPASM domain
VSLTGWKVQVILFSGGEPLLRPDIFELIGMTVKRGTRAVLSTNGLLITPKIAKALKDIGLSYVGISLDGLEEHHDRIRRNKGAFQQAVKSVSTSLAAGLKVGLRLTLTKGNQNDINGLFDFMEEMKIPRVCFYHLVDNKANPRLSSESMTHGETRRALDLICQRTQDMFNKGLSPEVLTVDNQADGPYLYLKLLAEGRKKQAENALKLLKLNGGSSSGLGIGCVSWNGDVHPDQFWRDVVLGSVREKPFPELWSDPGNELLVKLKNKKSYITGRCASCRFLDICGGGLRARAAYATGDYWAPDPACFLTQEEILPSSPPLASGM